MEQKRCKHAAIVVKSLKKSGTFWAIVAGGCYVKTENDLFLKKKKQTWCDTNSVELFNFKTLKWKTFCASLAIARHSATVCEMNGYLYVSGGHRVELPTEFIYSIERCHLSSLQSSFDLIKMDYNMMKLQLQTIVSFPSSDDNCLLIMGQTDQGSN